MARPKKPATYPGIYLRGRLWWFRYTAGKIERRVPLKTADEKEAARRAKRIHLQGITEHAGTMEAEVSAYVARSIETKKLSAYFGESRRRALLSEAKRMGWGSPGAVTARDLQDYYDALRRNRAEATALSYLMAWRGLFTWLSDQRPPRADSNPAKEVRVSRVRLNVGKRFLRHAEVARMFEHAGTQEMRFILHAGFNAGMRRGEIVNARPEWFDLENGLLHIGNRPAGMLGPEDRGFVTKWGRERTVPIRAGFAAFLRESGLMENHPFVIYPERREGKTMIRYDPRVPFKAVTEKAGVSCGLHDMRRTFASLLVSGGVSLYKVARWLGDGIKTASDHYAHLLPDKDKDIELKG